MDASKTKDEKPAKMPADRVTAGEIVVETILGAAAGATTGVLAGPPGVIAGAMIGGAVGAVAATALHADHEKAAREEALDRDIGVIGGDLGAAVENAPKSARGVFHAASLGITSAGTAPSEGPIQSLDEE
jgi:hypothetical protein